jgi:hypothetical protein
VHSLFAQQFDEAGGVGVVTVEVVMVEIDVVFGNCEELEL